MKTENPQEQPQRPVVKDQPIESPARIADAAEVQWRMALISVGVRTDASGLVPSKDSDTRIKTG